MPSSAIRMSNRCTVGSSGRQGVLSTQYSVTSWQGFGLGTEYCVLSTTPTVISEEGNDARFQRAFHQGRAPQLAAGGVDLGALALAHLDAQAQAPQPFHERRQGLLRRPEVRQP